jgi:hypothetical protein
VLNGFRSGFPDKSSQFTQTALLDATANLRVARPQCGLRKLSIRTGMLPHSAMSYTVLRKTHTVLAYRLCLMFVTDFGAVLFHTLIVRDGLFGMAPWRVHTG